MMQAGVGDKLTITGRRPGDAERHCEIIEVQGENGSPPYLVRWQDGTESVVFLRDESRGSSSQLITQVQAADKNGPVS